MRLVDTISPALSPGSKTGVILACLVLTTILTSGCSDNSVGFDSGKIAALVEQNGINMLNKRDVPVYFFAVEQGIAARINWAPISRKENEITPWSQRSVAFSEIYGYEEGRAVIIYYWSGKDPAPGDIQHLVISTDK